MNRITFLREMHQKSVDILEMIEKSDRLAQEASRYITFAKNNPHSWCVYTIPIEEKKLDKYLKISLRLMQYYANVQVKINKPIIERMNNVKPLCSFKITEDHAVQLTGLS
jgi:hypothetical protein